MKHVPHFLQFRVDADVDWSKRWLTQAFLISTLCALLLAAHAANLPASTDLGLAALYWWVRLSIAFVLFTGGCLLLESTRLTWFVSWKVCALIAMVITLPIFVMFATMLDLAVGLPELGASLKSDARTGLGWELALEALYLSDNYAIYCVLMCVPRWWNERFAKLVLDTPAPVDEAGGDVAGASPTFFRHAKPAPRGRLYLVEAQEHYIRIETAGGSSTALYRFGDALRELRDLPGMQVHRSTWVADCAVAGLAKRGGRMTLRLVDGRDIAVSRRFEVPAAQRYGNPATANSAAA
jgi:hypothetical protein